MCVVGGNGVITGNCKIFCCPVEGFDKSNLVVDDHGFFMGKTELGITVFHFDTGILQEFSRFCNFLLRRSYVPDLA